MLHQNWNAKLTAAEVYPVFVESIPIERLFPNYAKSYLKNVLPYFIPEYESPELLKMIQRKLEPVFKAVQHPDKHRDFDYRKESIEVGLFHIKGPFYVFVIDIPWSKNYPGIIKLKSSNA